MPRHQHPTNRPPHPISPFSFLLFSLLLFSFLPCFAQNIETNPQIEVIGSAQMEVIPNEINVQITLKEYLEGKYKVTVSEQEAKMKNMFKIAGIDLSKLNLANENADFVTVTKKDRDIVVTDKTFILTVTSPYMLTNTFQVLSGLNIKDARVVSVTHSQMDSLQQVVKVKAIQDAKEKAKSLLGAIGSRLGKPLIVRELDLFIVEDKDIVENEYELVFRKINIQSSVFARFAIE